MFNPLYHVDLLIVMRSFGAYSKWNYAIFPILLKFHLSSCQISFVCSEMSNIHKHWESLKTFIVKDCVSYQYKITSKNNVLKILAMNNLEINLYDESF